MNYIIYPNSEILGFNLNRVSTFLIPYRTLIPTIFSATPSVILQLQTLTITLTQMPVGFTLNSISLGGTLLNSPTKVSDSVITGVLDLLHPLGANQTIVITYNTSKTLTSTNITVDVA